MRSHGRSQLQLITPTSTQPSITPFLAWLLPSSSSFISYSNAKFGPSGSMRDQLELHRQICETYDEELAIRDKMVTLLQDRVGRFKDRWQKAKNTLGPVLLDFERVLEEHEAEERESRSGLVAGPSTSPARHSFSQPGNSSSDTLREHLESELAISDDLRRKLLVAQDEADEWKEVAETKAQDALKVKEALENARRESERMREDMQDMQRRAQVEKDRMMQSVGRKENRRDGEVEALQEQMEKQQRELVELSRKLEDERRVAQQEKDQLEMSLQQERQARQDLLSNLDEADERLASAEDARRQAQQEMDELRKQNQQTLKVQRQLQHDLSGLRHAIEELLEVKDDPSVPLPEFVNAVKRKTAETQQLDSRRQARIIELERKSAAMELDRNGLRKKMDELRDDQEGLNLALETKQQELEMIKRNMGVRGTAGSTPAVDGKTGVQSRRSSNVFDGATPFGGAPLGSASQYDETPRVGKLLPRAASGVLLPRSSSSMGGVRAKHVRMSMSLESIGGSPPSASVRRRPKLFLPTTPAFGEGVGGGESEYETDASGKENSRPMMAMEAR